MTQRRTVSALLALLFAVGVVVGVAPTASAAPDVEVAAKTILAGDPRVRAAIDESRRLFEQMGAGFWLARLEEALAADRSAPVVPARPAGVGSAIPQ